MPSSRATLATRIAAKVANADNMPPAEELPKISFIDAFLPGRMLLATTPRSTKAGSPAEASSEKVTTGRDEPATMKHLTRWTRFLPVKIYDIDADTGQPTDPNVARKVHVTYYDIKKKNGSKIIEKHKSPNPSAHGKSKMEDPVVEPPKSDQGGKRAPDQNDDDKKDEVKKTEKAGGGDDKPAEQPWTPDQDARLRELKASNTPWAQIAAQLGGRPKWQLTARWKEIHGKPVEGAGAEEQEKKKEEPPPPPQQPQHEGKKGRKGKKNRSGPEAENPTIPPPPPPPPTPPATTKPPSKPPSKAPSHPNPNPDPATAAPPPPEREAETRFTLHEWQTLQSDPLFTLGELQCLSELIMRDAHMTWLRVAAAFYDKTGRRVHPDDIRDKFEMMAGMGS